MQPTQQPSQARIVPFNPQQPVGSAIIDAQGREIPITEQMILQACRELEQSLQQRQAG